MRVVLIARAAAARGHAVTIVSGGMPVPHLDVGRARLVQLPPLRAADASFRRLLDDSGCDVDETWWAARGRALDAAVAEVDPEGVVVEQFPFGRRKLGRELIPMLERLRARPRRPVIAASVRDVLTAQADPARCDAMAAIARRLFDVVLVHGEPAVLPFGASFPRADAIADLIRYTGYVVAPPSPPPADGTGSDEILVSAGGGAVALPLLRAALAAAGRTSHRWRILVGGGIDEATFETLRSAAPANAIVERNRPDFPALLAACAVSVSQGGYNTVLEALTAGARPVIVPFATDGQTEQMQRAARLREMGWLATIEEDRLDAPALLGAVEAMLARPKGATPALDRDGAAASVAILEWLVACHADLARA